MKNPNWKIKKCISSPWRYLSQSAEPALWFFLSLIHLSVSSVLIVEIHVGHCRCSDMQQWHWGPDTECLKKRKAGRVMETPSREMMWQSEGLLSAHCPACLEKKPQYSSKTTHLQGPPPLPRSEQQCSYQHSTVKPQPKASDCNLSRSLWVKESSCPVHISSSCSFFSAELTAPSHTYNMYTFVYLMTSSWRTSVIHISCSLPQNYSQSVVHTLVAQ